MSIILKGVDLPTNGQIEIIIRPHGKVLSKTRGISAEAIQIPKEHGRLIDEDEIYEQPHCGECNDATLDAINNAPTILDEEGK